MTAWRAGSGADLPAGGAFLDIGLPGMDGYKLAQRLRQLPGLEGVLLVALTGYGQEEDRRHALMGREP